MRVGCLPVALAVAAGISVYLHWAGQVPVVQFPGIPVPQPNGYDACAVAIQKLGTVADQSPVNHPLEVAPAELAASLQPREAALGELRQALRQAYRIPENASPEEVTGNLDRYRTAGRMFVAQARVAEVRGKHAEAMDRALDAVELGARVGTGGLLFHHMVAIPIAFNGVNAAEPLVEKLSAEEAAAAGRRLDTLLTEMPSFADAMEMERRSRLTAYRGDLETSSQLSKGRVALTPLSWSFRTMSHWLADLQRNASEPYRRREAPPAPENRVARELMEVYPQASFLFSWRDAALRMLRLELALREHQVRQKEYPDSLQKLGITNAATLEDPFTGRPLLYERASTGYYLYSTGPDAVDDHAKSIPWASIAPDAHGDLVAGTMHP